MTATAPAARQRLRCRGALAAALALVVLPGGAAAVAGTPGKPITQTVDGHIATFYEAPIHLTQPSLDAHQSTAPRGNGAMTWAFNIASGTHGKRFDLRERRDPSHVDTASGQSTFGLVFLDRPLGQAGAKVVAVVDKQISGAETGVVPVKARSAFVYATHGLDRVFRYRTSS